MDDTNKFPDGIYFKEKGVTAPEFVKGSISIKVDKAIAWLKENANDGGYVNLDLKISKGGKAYCEKNTWTPAKKETTERPDLSNVTF